jgi:Domain of unknown function (DUF929)
MAKKKHRPTSPSVNVKPASSQHSVAQEKGTSLNVSSSSSVERQKELTTVQGTSDTSPVEERQSENITSKQVKSPSSNPSALSAAERRRKRVTSQRTSSNARSTSSARERRRRATRKSWWGSGSFVLIAGILLVVAIAVGTFIIIAMAPSQQVGNGKISSTDPKILQEVTTVPPSVFANVKAGNANNLLSPPAGNPPPLTGADGKPKVFFYGAEFCPLCAAQRWSVVVALSRFGTFTELPLTVSADPQLEPTLPDIPTFTFVNAKYSSDYIDFDSLEAQDRSRGPLQTPSSSQQQLLTQNKVDGFPFMDIANKYVIRGTMVDPTSLKGLSQQEIAGMLSDPTKDVTRRIVGAANYLTAAICSANDNKPANVCESDPIPELRSALSKTALTSFSSTAPLSVATENCPGELATCRRREAALL